MDRRVKDAMEEISSPVGMEGRPSGGVISEGWMDGIERGVGNSDEVVVAMVVAKEVGVARQHIVVVVVNIVVVVVAFVVAGNIGFDVVADVDVVVVMDFYIAFRVNDVAAVAVVCCC